MENIRVELSSVRKTFGPTVALDNCNLQAYEGEVHAIVGGNGSGKSTLAKVLSGVLIPDSGRVSVMGEVATTPLQARRLGVSNVFQEVLVAEGATVLDNLYMGSDGLFTASANREQKATRAHKFMKELLGFELDLGEKVGNLPLSIKQWITIARGLLAEPKVLILDESSAALDFEATERLFKKIRELKSTGTSILIVTHRVPELIRIADRATVLRDGRDVGTLSKEDITEHNILELIAGPQTIEKESARPAIDIQNGKPLLRIERARVWENSSEINLNLYPGEIIGITGLDGQGQADFARSIAGVTSLISGRISVIKNGTAHEVEDLKSARTNHISYVSGDRKKEGIFPNLSIYENLVVPIYEKYKLGGPLGIVNRTKLTPIFNWESEKLRTKMSSSNHLITSLSGGNQQKILIARAFAEDPLILVLNDPARGIDVGAKQDLYQNLKAFSARGRTTVFLSSEIEEFIDLCTYVYVFRNGTISSKFTPPFNVNTILNASFGRKKPSPLDYQVENGFDTSQHTNSEKIKFENGRPIPRPLKATLNNDSQRKLDGESEMQTTGTDFFITCPDIRPGSTIPEKFTENSKISPALRWTGTPMGTRSFAIAVTDPDLPDEFGFPRCFAHWLVYDIPSTVNQIHEGSSGTSKMPDGSKELNSDFVTFNVPGFGRGYGGPWPPDREHRYFFTLYALMREQLDIAIDADLVEFYRAVMPITIDSTSFIALYGPAKKPLPS